MYSITLCHIDIGELFNHLIHFRPNNWLGKCYAHVTISWNGIVELLTNLCLCTYVDYSISPVSLIHNNELIHDNESQSQRISLKI